MFEPTDAALQQTLSAVRPAAYARTRNHLDGAVTRLSPYLTHGFIDLPTALATLAPQGLPPGHKLVFEFGWREYFRHVWQHRGDGILQSLHEGPLPEAAYRKTMPDDVRSARTGVPAIDAAVRELVATGWLHNHARMWLASYLVHVRKVHWRTGADWMLGLLLDGDVASNHLSWQWVAGTGSGKPYLFNADNVARYAPAGWHSPGTVIDTGYAELDALARGRSRVPEAIAGKTTAADDGERGLEHPGIEPARHAEPPADDAVPGLPPLSAPQAAQIAGRDVWLIHPWALRPPPATRSGGLLCLGVLEANVHAAWPWSAMRWRFVMTRLAQLAEQVWWGPTGDIVAALAAARSVGGWSDPHVSADLRRAAALEAPPTLFDGPDRPCASFTQWWTRAMHRDDRFQTGHRR